MPAMTQLEKAYQSLRDGIVSGELPPDSPLRLNALSTRYGVGYSPLREALNRLHGERLVTAESLRGFRVAPLSLDAMWDTIRTRILIETEALRLSIDKGDDDWSAALVAALHAFVQQAGRTGPDRDLALLERRHHALHRALIAACGSAWLLELAEQLYVGSVRYRFPTLVHLGTHRFRDIAGEHTEIVEAALARDADRAAELLKAHYSRSGASIEAAMCATGAEPPADDSAADTTRGGIAPDKANA